MGTTCYVCESAVNELRNNLGGNMWLDEFQQPQNTSAVTVVVSDEIRKCISLILV